jgi:alanyl-tRNA synthetase
MTEKLFYEDSHIKEFTATVKACHQENKYFEVVLDRTAFFPEGGGQYADAGRLNEIPVIDVREQDGVIFHITKSPLTEGEEVHGRIEWELRFMKMQQHTGEHIVSGLIHDRFGYRNVGFHLGTRDCTMDFNGEISKEEMEEIEVLANGAVAANVDVQISYPTDEELIDLEYRSKIEIEGQVRIVTIPKYDACACCAPHVKKTGEIGLIKLTDVQRYKSGVRISMLCGFRALEDYGKKQWNIKRISNLLCAKEEEVFDAVNRLKEENIRLKENVRDIQNKVLEYKSKSVLPDQKFVCFFEGELDGNSSRVLMNQVLKQGKTVCAVFWETGKDEYGYVMGSSILDMRSFAKEINENFQGRGGGKPEMVQGALKGRESEVRAWLQKKVRNLENE